MPSATVVLIMRSGTQKVMTVLLYLSLLLNSVRKCRCRGCQMTLIIPPSYRLDVNCNRTKTPLNQTRTNQNRTGQTQQEPESTPFLPKRLSCAYYCTFKYLCLLIYGFVIYSFYFFVCCVTEHLFIEIIIVVIVVYF